eukprot:1191568-Rhodomonas_salina.1
MSSSNTVLRQPPHRKHAVPCNASERARDQSYHGRPVVGRLGGEAEDAVVVVAALHVTGGPLHLPAPRKGCALPRPRRWSQNAPPQYRVAHTSMWHDHTALLQYRALSHGTIPAKYRAHARTWPGTIIMR